MTGLFLELLQIALGNRGKLSRNPSEKEWRELMTICQKQSVGSFVFVAIERLSNAGQKPPMSILYEWIGLSETVKMQDTLMNQEASRLTRLFEQEGHKTAILKGQANARLYPYPWSRQPGDIDIWVDGGLIKVTDTLKKLRLIKGEIAKYQTEGTATLEYHHIHLPKNEKGIDIEVHYRPTSKNMNPFTNKRLQNVLEKEINKENQLVEEGFRVPDLRFALLMQLAHIQAHLFSEGVGMRQIVDYYYLLHSGKCGQIVKINELRSMGLNHIAGAVMWVENKMLFLDKEYLIAPMDEKRGRMLFQTIINGGTLGRRYYDERTQGSFRGIISKHMYRWNMVKFDASEAIWKELNSAFFFFTSIPERIKRRKWSLE